MSFPAKSKDVCSGCRARKKKCNGTRPACTPCLKRGGICVYTPPPTNVQLTFAGDGWFAAEDLDAVLTDVPGWPASGLASGQLPGNASVPPVAFTEAPSWFELGPDIVPMTETIQGLPTPENASPKSDSEPAVPSLDVILDLVDVFFERFYPNLPILHKRQLVSRLQACGADGISPALLFAVLTVAASGHPSAPIRANQTHWRSLARDALRKSLPTEEQPLQTLQAAVLLVFAALQQGDYPVTWMLLGEAWRKAAVIGYHQVDARDNETLVQYLGSVRGLDGPVQREECRRVVWAFFILDRGLCYPIGMVHAVDERCLVVHFPMSEDCFQGLLAEQTAVDGPALMYTNDLDRLIARVREHGRHAGACTMLHYVLLAYVLLGRVTEQVYMQDADEERPAALDALIEQLVQIRLLLPGCASDVSLAKPGDVPYVVWLSAVLSVSTIFLHHRALRCDDDAAVVAAQWPHAVRAARNTVQLLRDASRAGPASSFMLAHTTAALFVSTRVLIMEYLCPGAGHHHHQPSADARRDTALRSDLQVLAAFSMQAHSSLGLMGKRFLIGFKFHIRMREEDVRAGKDYGARGLLKRCGDWAVADDGQGIVIPE
ncbi:MFS transporter, putative [Cordyceps militaris CM01]|uniref:MFS transporter, putative n=1 Tax=Cordyceps militaris (strain CM01) TaxID=983644 RepID=G3JF85_CORMM|nr:MFS transporter, putative [Cordyceps militaris CM01]EGX93525.1 MFS transporter, putative [Cordyceps militaris CM01]